MLRYHLREKAVRRDGLAVAIDEKYNRVLLLSEANFDLVWLRRARNHKRFGELNLDLQALTGVVSDLPGEVQVFGLCEPAGNHLDFEAIGVFSLLFLSRR